MNNQGKYQDDPLWKYLSPETREETPEGFTSKVMTRVGLETTPLKESLWKRNHVPFIYVFVIIMLFAVAFLIPGGQSDSVPQTLLSYLKNIKIPVPEIHLPSFFMISIPSVIIYAFIGILVLTVFDRALYGLFKKEK